MEFIYGGITYEVDPGIISAQELVKRVGNGGMVIVPLVGDKDLIVRISKDSDYALKIDSGQIKLEKGLHEF